MADGDVLQVASGHQTFAPLDAITVPYDDTTSQLGASNVQELGDALAARGGGLPTGWTQDESDPADVDTNGGDLTVAALDVAEVSIRGTNGPGLLSIYDGGGNQAGVTAMVSNPTMSPGFDAQRGSIGLRTNGQAWLKTGVGGTDWAALGTADPGIRIVRFPFAFDDAGIGPTMLNITALDAVSETGSVTVAGDHAAAFPAGSAVAILGSSANDGTYTSTGASFAEGSTTITLVEQLSDPTVDGAVYDSTSGVVAYTPSAGDTVTGGWISIPPSTSFDGTPSLHLQVEGDAVDAAFGGAFGGNNTDGVLNRSVQIAIPLILGGDPPTPVVLPTTSPVRFMISGGTNDVPADSMQGAGELVMLVAPA